MKKKSIALSVGIAFILGALVFYLANTDLTPENAFPLDKAVIEQAMQAQGLPWTVGEYSTMAEAQSTYMLHNENGKIVSTINSIVTDGKRALTLGLIFENIKVKPENKLSQELTEKDWLSVFDLTARLYGGKSNGKKVFEQVSKYLDNEKHEPEDRIINWDKKLGDVHYVVIFKPSLRYYGSFALYGIEMYNESGYQKRYPSGSAR